MTGVSDTLTLYWAIHQLIAAQTAELKGYLMTAREDVQAVVTQLGKAKDEILARLAELQTAIDNGTVTVADLQPLRDAAQSLDDIVPDVPEPPAEGEV